LKTIKAKGQYWTKELDDVIVAFNNATGTDKQRLWLELHPYVHAMNNAILRRYNGGNFKYFLEGELEDLLAEAELLLFSKLHLYNNKFKSYSYIQTILRNFYRDYFKNPKFQARAVSEKLGDYIDEVADEDLGDLRIEAATVLKRSIQNEKHKTIKEVLIAYYDYLFVMTDPNRFNKHYLNLYMFRATKLSANSIKSALAKYDIDFTALSKQGLKKIIIKYIKVGNLRYNQGLVIQDYEAEAIQRYYEEKEKRNERYKTYSISDPVARRTKRKKALGIKEPS
jgi:DNA-directed RNA polymerase specialized sigma24 family protein